MSFDINDLDLPLQRTINMGEIDRWLRGLAGLVPQTAERGSQIHQERELHTVPAMEVSLLDMNTHVLSFGSHEKIGDSQIERLVGFSRLVAACTKNDIRVDITNMGKGTLNVSFEPDEPFSKSVIFGANYFNVLPIIAGIKKSGQSY